MRLRFLFFSILSIFFMGCEENVTNVVQTKPVVSFISPQNSSIVSNPVEIRIRATDDKKIIRVELMINHSLYKYIDTLANEYVFNWNTGSFTDGTQHILTAISYDDDGNKGEANVVVHLYRFTPYLYQAAIMNDSSFQIRWIDNSDIETGFEIERAINDSNFTRVLVVNSGTDVAVVKEKIDFTKTYYFRMRAFNSTHWSTYSQVVKAEIKLHAPVISNPTITADTLFNITWVDNNLYEEGYRVYINDSVFTFPPNTNSAQIRYDFYTNTKYTFIVKAFAFGRESEPSNSLWTYLNVTEPTELRLINEFPDKIHLKWNDNSNFEHGFIIYRAIGSLPFTEIARTGSNVNEYGDENIVPNFEYTYGVKAFTKINLSTYSNSLKVAYKDGMSIVDTKTSSLINNGYFSNDYKFLFRHYQNSIEMYDGASFSSIRRFEMPPDQNYSYSYSIVSNADGSRVAKHIDFYEGAQNYYKKIALWNTTDGKLISYFNINCWIFMYALSADATTMAMRECDITKLISTENGSQIRTLTSGIATNYFAHSSSNQYFVYSSTAINLYDLNTGLLKKTLNLSPTTHSIIGISEDGNYITTINNVGQLQLRNLNSDEIIFSSTEYNVAFRKAYLTDDYKFLFVSTNNSIRLYDVLAGKLLHNLPIGVEVKNVVHRKDLDKIFAHTQEKLFTIEVLKAWRAIN